MKDQNSDITIVKLTNGAPRAAGALYFNHNEHGWLPVLDTTADIETSSVTIVLGDAETGAYMCTVESDYSHTEEFLVAQGHAEAEMSVEYEEHGWPDGVTRSTPGKSNLNQLAEREGMVFSRFGDDGHETALERWLRQQARGYLLSYTDHTEAEIAEMSPLEIVEEYGEWAIDRDTFDMEREELTDLVFQIAAKAQKFDIPADEIAADVRNAVEQRKGR